MTKNQQEHQEPPPYKEKAYISIVVTGCLGLIISIFSFTTLFSMTLICFGVFLYLKTSMENLKKRGWMSRVPAKLRDILLSRSIFDVLCDMWYLPKLSLYFKVLFRPFIYQITPEEAISNLEELPPNIKKAMLTKGVVNIFPEKIKEFLLEESDKSEEEESNLNVLEKCDTCPSERQRKFFPDHETTIVTLGDNSCRGLCQSYEEERNVLSDNFSVKSCDILNQQQYSDSNESQEGGHLTENEVLAESQYKKKGASKRKNQKSKSKIKQIIFSPFLNKLNLFSRGPDNKNKQIPDKDLLLRKTPSTGSGSGSNNGSQQGACQEIQPYRSQSQQSAPSNGNMPRTQVLYSSYTLFKNKSQARISAIWDKLELFKQSKSATELEKTNKFVPKRNLIGPLQILTQIMDFTQNGFLTKIDNKKIAKVCVVSTVLFLVQVIASRRVRSWCSHTVKLIIYLITILMASGSTGLLALKYIKSKRTKLQDK